MNATSQRAGNVPALNDAERAKLAGILGRLGSDFEGERDNAARMATKFVRERRLAWVEVLAPIAVLEDRRAERDDIGDWRATAMALARLDLNWSVFELRFLTGLPSFRTISTKQREILIELVERAQRCGAWGLR